MEKKKTVFDYLAQVFTTFGFTMLVMNIFCLIFGDSAKEFSAMYELGSQGIPVNIAFQFFLYIYSYCKCPFCFFYGRCYKENAHMVADNLYAGGYCCNYCRVYNSVSLVPDRYVAAMGNVFFVLRPFFSGKLFCNEYKRKHGKQKNGRGAEAFKRKGGQKSSVNNFFILTHNYLKEIL